MSRLALYLLGPPHIKRDGQAVDVGRRKAVALLAYLAVTGQGHSRDALATLFWPEHDQSRARAGLRRTLASFSSQRPADNLFETQSDENDGWGREQEGAAWVGAATDAY